MPDRDTPHPPEVRDLTPPEAAIVLLVDDERAFADALAFRLQVRGIPTTAVYRGEEAVALLNSPDLEVVLLDLNMPGLHGLEALRRIKAERPDLEVVLLTGDANLSAAARGMRRGAGDYLLKPVDFDVLLESLGKARQRAQECRERRRAAEAGKLMALGALAAGVGHEINNPLQIILQSAGWLEELAEDAARGHPDPEGMGKAAGVIKKQAARAGVITAQLLDLARRSREGAVETILPELIRKVVAAQAERAAAIGAVVSVDLPADLPALPCSPAEFEPALHHLVRNALDAVEARYGAPGRESGEKTVRVSAVLAGSEVRLFVADTGEGIAPENAPRVFEPFFSTRAVGRGTGLGLTICHGIISALRGKIRFAGMAGGGTVFTVHIPVRPMSP